MREYSIDHFQKGLYSESEAKARKLRDKWSEVFHGVGSGEAIILENQSRYLSEATQTPDVQGYDNFVLELNRRSFNKLFVNELVSVQPMLAPKSKVFYIDPEVTTGTSTDYVDMYTSLRDNENYDTSKGAYTLTTGNTTGITEANYNSGLTFNLDYSGGVEGLASLVIKAEGGAAGGDLVDALATNGTVTTASTGVLFSNAGSAIFDNDIANTFVLGNLSATYTVTFEFNTTPTTNVVGYTIKFGGISALANNWQFCGSTDGVSWTQLDSQVGFTTGSVSTAILFSITPTNLYKFYRFDQMGSTTNVFQLQELEIIGAGGLYSETFDYAMSPQTWSEDLLANNQIQVMVSQTGSSLAGTADTYAEWREYSSLEATSGMQTVKLKVTSQDVDASQTRKLKAKWTEELEQDFVHYGFGHVVDEYASLMSQEIAEEIDREVIRDLINIAPFRSEWHYDMYSMSSITGSNFYTGDVRDITGIDLSAVTNFQWITDSLYTKINEMDGIIRKHNIHHGSSWILCSTEVGAVIQSMKEFCTEMGTLIDEDQTYYVGKLSGRQKVYIDPYLPKNVCLIGYKGQGWESGYIFAPYVMANTQEIRDPDNLFEKSSNFISRYGKLVVNNKKYGLINCTFTENDADYPVNYS